MNLNNLFYLISAEVWFNFIHAPYSNRGPEQTKQDRKIFWFMLNYKKDV